MSIIIVSMAPMGVVPLRMSKLDGEPPKMTGAPGPGEPGRWPGPTRFSTTCWTSVPAIVAGEVGPGHAHGDELRGDARPGAVDQALGRQVAPLEGRGGTGVEDRQGLPPELLGPAADGGQHLEHRPEARRRGTSRSRSAWPRRAARRSSRKLSARHRGDVGGDERRALEVDVRAGVGDAGDVDQVGVRGFRSRWVA